MAQILAALDDYPLLPKSKHTPAEIVADPGAYASDAAAALESPPVHEPDPNVTPPGQSPGQIMRDIGSRALTWGMWGAIAGMVALLLRFVPIWGIGAIFSWGPVARLAGIAASTGSLATIVGSATMWLADYLWLIVLITVLGVVGVAVFHLFGFDKRWSAACKSMLAKYRNKAAP